MASTHVLAVGPTPTLKLHEIEGDLTLTGWERPELLARRSLSARERALLEEFQREHEHESSKA